MRQHGAPLVGQIQDIPVTLQALIILEGGVGHLPVLRVVVRALGEVRHHILDAMKGLGIKKVEGILRRGQMAVHAIRHKPLAVVDVGGSLPGLVGELDFMAGGTELRGRSAHHGIISKTEQRQSDDETAEHIKGGAQPPFHASHRTFGSKGAPQRQAPSGSMTLSHNQPLRVHFHWLALHLMWARAK